jgi:hypothetical protein
MTFAITPLRHGQTRSGPAQPGRVANLMRFSPVLVPLGLLPLFAAAILLNTPGFAARTLTAVLAPAFFYCGYAMLAVKGASRKLERRQAKFERDVRLRMDEFNPQETRLSREFFELRLAQEVRRSKRHRLPLSILTVTLPPQTSGRGVFTSDLVLITAGALRAEDTFGRLGLNQYVISLPHTTPAGAGAVIERLTSQLAGHDPHFGIAYLSPGRYAPPERLIELALAAPVEPDALAARTDMTSNES